MSWHPAVHAAEQNHCSPGHTDVHRLLSPAAAELHRQLSEQVSGPGKNLPVPLMAAATCGVWLPFLVNSCVFLHWGQGQCPGSFLEPCVCSRLGRLQQDWRQPSWRHLSSWAAVKLKHCCGKQRGCVCWRHFGEISEQCLLSLVVE